METFVLLDQISYLFEVRIIHLSEFNNDVSYYNNIKSFGGKQA